MKVTVIIPCKNEERTIGEIIDRCKPFADEIVIALSKNSSDDSEKIAREKGCRVLVDNGKGKGAGMRLAIKEIETDIMVFFDADGSHIPEDIPRLLEPVKKDEADVVIGSRLTGGSEELSGTLGNFFRLFACMVITLLINYRFGVRLSDSQNGFRAMKASAVKSLKLKSNIFDIETEMLMKFLKKKYRVTEVPTKELKRRYGGSGINIIKMGWLYAWTTFSNMI